MLSHALFIDPIENAEDKIDRFPTTIAQTSQFEQFRK